MERFATAQPFSAEAASTLCEARFMAQASYPETTGSEAASLTPLRATP